MRLASVVSRFLKSTLLIAALSSTAALANFCEQALSDNLVQVRPKHFRSGLNRTIFETMASPEGAGKQRSQNWCWAATMQMLLNYHGIYAAQETDVLLRFGQLVDRPANTWEILESLNTVRFQLNRGPVRVVADEIGLDLNVILQELSSGRPLIVGLSNPYGGAVGHAYLLTSAEWSMEMGGPRLHSVTLRDPMPGNPSVNIFSGFDFFRRAYMFIRVRVP
jgi:hypothetical protein